MSSDEAVETTPLKDKQMQEMQCAYYIPTMEYYSALKMEENSDM